jgi:hypothetical protein
MVLHDILDEETAINIRPSLHAAAFEIHDIGFLTYRFHHNEISGRIEVLIEIELRWHPRLYVDYVNEMSKRIRHRLLATLPELDKSIQNGGTTLSIRFHPPGSLDDLAEA